MEFRSKNLGPVLPCSPHRESDDTPTLLLDLVIHMHGKASLGLGPLGSVLVPDGRTMLRALESLSDVLHTASSQSSHAVTATGSDESSLSFARQSQHLFPQLRDNASGNSNMRSQSQWTTNMRSQSQWTTGNRESDGTVKHVCCHASTDCGLAWPQMELIRPDLRRRHSLSHLRAGCPGSTH